MLFLFIHFSCNLKEISNNENDAPMVKVGNKILFESDLNELVHEGVSVEDSMAIVTAYIDNWVKDNLMIIEAEKNIPADLNLDKLVADYRSSLLLHNYENTLIKEKLDTLVTDYQIKEFYEEYGQQYILSHQIIKCWILKVPHKHPDLKKIKDGLKNANFEKIEKFAKYQNVKKVSDGQIWLSMSEMSILTSANLFKFSDLKKDIDLWKKSGDYEYYVKVVESYDEKEIPPLNYIEDKIKKVILNTRKTELLKNIRENLYNKQVFTNQVKIY